MIKPTLVYLNPDCFTQVDDTVLSHLTKDFEVVWFYIYESKHAKIMRYNPDEAKKYAEKYGIKLEVVDPMVRMRDPRNILFYFKLAKKINSYNPLIVYSCDILFWMLCYRKIYCKNKVLGIHDVSLHSYKFSYSLQIIQFIKEYLLKRFNHICTFSKNQHNLLKGKFGKESYMVGMSYKSFGESLDTPGPLSNGIRLLFFGSINVYKGLDLLIEAIEALKERGIDNLKLTIAGKGISWNDYKELIRTYELYNLQIRFIDNNEIPGIMSSHHFIVLPYRNATQSGPLVTALGYGVPSIAPRYGCFTDIFDDNTAILYNPGELQVALNKVSNMTEESYLLLKKAVLKHRENYSEEKIAHNYISVFKKISNSDVQKD